MSGEAESRLKVAIKFSRDWDNRDYHSDKKLQTPNVEWPYWSAQQAVQCMIASKYGALLREEDPFNHNRSSTTVHFSGREDMTSAEKRLLDECLRNLRVFGTVQTNNVQNGRVNRAAFCKPLERRCIEADEEL